MYLYLSSFKIGNKPNLLKNWIKKYNNDKILLIVNARDSDPQNDNKINIINSDCKALEELGFKVTILDLKHYFYKEHLLYNYIQKNNFKAFFTIGGNVFTLRLAMKLSGFDKFLNKVSKENGYLYAGYSAGICVLGPKLNGFEIVVPKTNPYNCDKITNDGLGLIKYVIAPHYKSRHKSTNLIDELVTYFEDNNIKYKVLRDGEVISNIEEDIQ